MHRIALIFLVACVQRPAPQAPVVAAPAPVAQPAQPPAPVNLVCSAFNGVNQAAGCAPIHTDVGDLRIHTATVTLGQQQFACRTDLSMLGVLCSDPIVIKQQPPPPTQDAPAKKKPAKGKK